MAVITKAILAVGAAVALHGAPPAADEVLPDVDSLLGFAETSVKEFNKQAGFMRQEVRMNQQKMQERLWARKNLMQENLTGLDTRIGNVEKKNTRLRAKIQLLINSTQEQKVEGRRWQASTNFLREALAALHAKMHVVSDLLVESVNATQTAGTRELQVLTTTTAVPATVEKFLSAVDAVEPTKDESVSLLSMQYPPNSLELFAEKLSKSGATPNSESMVMDFSRSLQELNETGSEEEAQLMGRFVAMREVSEKRLKHAQAENLELYHKVRELQGLEADLKPAFQQLKESHVDVVTRLRGLKEFATQVHDRNALAMENSSQVLAAAMARAAAVHKDAEKMVVNSTSAA